MDVLSTLIARNYWEFLVYKQIVCKTSCLATLFAYPVQMTEITLQGTNKTQCALVWFAFRRVVKCKAVRVDVRVRWKCRYRC
jgi:hypothetical protein